MLTKTNKEKRVFQHNDVKPQNIKDTKNTIKAFREEADQVQREKIQIGIMQFLQSLSYSATLSTTSGHPIQHTWDCALSLTLELEPSLVIYKQ